MSQGRIHISTQSITTHQSHRYQPTHTCIHTYIHTHIHAQTAHSIHQLTHYSLLVTHPRRKGVVALVVLHVVQPVPVISVPLTRNRHRERETERNTHNTHKHYSLLITHWNRYGRQQDKEKVNPTTELKSHRRPSEHAVTSPFVVFPARPRPI